MPIVLENFFQALVAGILVGGMYGLMCVGLGVIFGVMRVINFAQGEFLMLGMYVAIQWQGGEPVTVYPLESAFAPARWSKR